MTTLTTTALATEILEGTLLTLEQVSTRLTVLALNASRTPEQSPRVGCCWETCWRTFRTVSTTWAPIPFWMPDTASIAGAASESTGCP